MESSPFLSRFRSYGVLCTYTLARNSKMASLWNYLSLPNAVFTSPVAAILTPVTAGALVGYTTTSGEYTVLLVEVAPRQKTY
jgi:hypothetical protein